MGDERATTEIDDRPPRATDPSRNPCGSAEDHRSGAEAPVGLLQARMLDPADWTPEAEQRWRTLLASRTEVVVLMSAQGELIQSTNNLAGVLGYLNDDDVRTNPFARIHEDDLARTLEVFRQVADDPSLHPSEIIRARHADGHWERLECVARNELADPVLAGIVVRIRVVTDLLQTEAMLADEAAILQLVARNAPLTEVLGEIQRVVEDHTGGTATTALVDRTLHDDLGLGGSIELCSLTATAVETGEVVVVSDIDDDPITAPDVDVLRERNIRSGWSQPIVDTTGHEVIGTISVYHDQPSRPLERERTVVEVAAHLAAIAVERHIAQTTLEHQARHDQLTGLPNRWALMERLACSVERANTSERPMAVLLLDLDRFKVVNDSLGHRAGDELLIAFGARLRSLVASSDFVGHFGADEFAVVLDGIRDVEDVHYIASRLDLALSEPFTIDIETVDEASEQQIFLSTSIGVAITDGTPTTPHQLIQRADSAMYGAKNRGGDRLEVWDEELQSRAAEQLRLDADLRRAIERAELHLNYQPKIDLDTGRISGVEALLRWHHPDRGVVLPSEFIGAAEETGIIVRIGSWVIDEAIRQARAWLDRSPLRDQLTVAVNLSARQLGSASLVGTVERALTRYSWPAEDLTLELTESILIDDAEATLDVLEQLKRLGVKLAIDDFGTGYSSLSYLHRFPVDLVKVDRSFVTPLAADGHGSPVATAVIHMARALGLTCVAEGVEEPDQLAGLRALGCDIAQGYWFARPVPADALYQLLVDDPTW